MILDEIKEAYDIGNRHAQAMWGEVHSDFEDSVFFKRVKDCEIEDLKEVLRATQKVLKSDWESKDREKYLATFYFTEALDDEGTKNLWGDDYWREVSAQLKRHFD